MLFAVAFICISVGFLVGGLVVEHILYSDIDRKKYDEITARESQPTRYSTEPITFAVESHRGKFVVIAKSRNDRTVVREKDIMPMADELRKHHEYLAVVNEVSGTYGVKVEETATNEPPDPERPEHDWESHNEALPEYVHPNSAYHHRHNLPRYQGSSHANSPLAAYLRQKHITVNPGEDYTQWLTRMMYAEAERAPERE